MKKRIISLALTLILAFSLLPSGALAANEIYDVYQGDGFYITVKPYKLKSDKYTFGGYMGTVLDGQFHDGMLPVRTADIDENYVNRVFINEFNYADKDGNILFPEGLFHRDWQLAGPVADGDLAPSDGMIPFWDGKTDNGTEILLGYVDYNGKVVIPCKYTPSKIRPFKEGLSATGGWIDKSGRAVNELRRENMGIYTYTFSEGLAPGYIYDGDTRTHGYIDKSGNMALKLISYNEEDMMEYKTNYGIDYWKMCADGKTDGYLMPTNVATPPDNLIYGKDTSAFSEGYAVCYDLRSGNGLDYNFAIIDKKGNVVGTFSDARPSDRGFHGGLLYVDFIDNRGQRSGHGYVDTSGKVVLPDIDSYGDFSCGLNFVPQVGLVDTKGNIVIPWEHGLWTVKKFQDNLVLAYVDGHHSQNGWVPEQAYVLEKHEGTYTGGGKVYNHAKGGAQTSVPTKPTSSEPSSWAKDSVAEAVSANIVPASLQSAYTSPTTRAEFCALATKLYETVKGEISTRAEFTDTSDVNVQKMASIGVVNGVGNGKFNPNGSLTREQAATMLARLADAMGKPLPAASSSFADNSSISSWALEAVGQMQSSAIMSGVGSNKFGPKGNYTREQSIITALRLYNIVK